MKYLTEMVVIEYQIKKIKFKASCWIAAWRRIALL